MSDWRHAAVCIGAVLTGCRDPLGCPDTPMGGYFGSAVVLERGCTLEVGDVAPYDAVIDEEVLPHPDELCGSGFAGHIDGWEYDGRITYLADEMWTFSGWVQGKHCRLHLLITAHEDTR